MSNNLTLTFGKFKGQKLKDTPQWYQNWLTEQPWFNKPKTEKTLHQQLNGWDGHSRKGQAVYDSLFEQEKRMANTADSDWFNETFGY